jgi:hypothetical protein
MGWVVNTTHQPLYARERESVGTHSTRGWIGPGAGQDGSRKSHSDRDLVTGPFGS